MVVHIYTTTRPPILILSQTIEVDADVEAATAAAAILADLTTTGAVCLVAFDGDSGRRFTGDDWLSLAPDVRRLQSLDANMRAAEAAEGRWSQARRRGRPAR